MEVLNQIATNNNIEIVPTDNLFFTTECFTGAEVACISDDKPQPINTITNNQP